MPLYEYHCEDCGRDAELLVAANAQPDCPQCGSRKLSKLLSVVASPSREGSTAGQSDRPSGSCGAGCGCHPHG
ncbi:MAG: zinc ribbon domain-containing protein [Planctomycetes bacterium]|nr:zinc ribbon domain-containing protein [Planctomycetota bacterium]